MKDNRTKPKTEGGTMRIRTFTMPDDLFERSKAKAGMKPLSAVIRALLEAWLTGKIEVD